MKPIFIIKLFLTFGLFFVRTNKLAAQDQTSESADFSNAIGFRFGGTTGLDFKHKFNSLHSMEIIIGTYPDAFGVTGLYEQNVLTPINGLNLFFGFGGHISRAYNQTYGYFSNDRHRYYKTYGTGTIIGVDAIAGIEYKIPKVPLVASLDVKPFGEFYSGYGPYFNLDPALGIKFTF